MKDRVMERHFERDLNELKERCLDGQPGGARVHQGVHSVLDSDEQLAKRVLDEEDAINELQMRLTTAWCRFCVAPIDGDRSEVGAAVSR